MADLSPPRRTYASTTRAETAMQRSYFQPISVSSNLPRACREMPDEKMVITAKEMALKAWVLLSKRSLRYSGTDRAFEP